jgi:hypothetical protein
MERHHLSLVLLSHTLEVVAAAVQLLLVQVVLEVEEMAQLLPPVLLGVLEPRTLVVAAVVAEVILCQTVTEALAALV